MNYSFRFNDQLHISVSVKKSTFGKHPIVSTDVIYRGSSLYFPFSQETKCEGLQYESYSERNALTKALAMLNSVFLFYPFVYEDFPEHLEYNNDGKPIIPYKSSRFPKGSVFQVMDVKIDKRAETYYVLYNSEEGMVTAEGFLLCQFPIIENNYTLSSSWNDSGLGGLSKRILGKRFRVLEYGRYDKIVEEL